MAKIVKFPKPFKLYKGKAWVIAWHWKYKQYAVATPLDRKKEDEKEADIILRRFAAGLAEDPPKIPAQFTSTPGARRYLADRADVTLSTGWLKDYEPVISAEVVATWAKSSMSMLRRIEKYVGGHIERTTPNQAQGFLVSLLAAGLSPARRNRALIMANRFFKWAVRTKRTLENPFAGIKLLKEERDSDIVFCSKAERDAIIAMADSTDDPDALAVTIAFYAGLRRGELYRLDWKDIDIEGRFIHVRKGKTKVGRKVPIGRYLLAALTKVPAKKRKGLVIPLAPGVNAMEHASCYMEKLRRRARTGGATVSEEQISWNVFRHTFASLYIQEGGTLDKGCALLGNTREVFLRHYGNLHPRDRFDEFVDKL